MSTPASPTPHSTTGLATNVASGLAYVLGWVSGLILFLVEKEDREVRFHAAQSLVVSIAATVVLVALNVLGFVPFLGVIAVLVGVILSIAFFGLWVYLLIQAFSGAHVSLPWAGQLAEEWADRSV